MRVSQALVSTFVFWTASTVAQCNDPSNTLTSVKDPVIRRKRDLYLGEKPTRG